MKKYIGYVRVSTDEQKQHGFGIDTQHSTIRSYCEAMGYPLETIIADEGISGKDMNRPGIQRVIEMIQSGQYAGIVVSKLDRISRNLKDILVLHDEIMLEIGATMVSIKEQFDTATPVGKLMFQIIGGFAEFERSMIKDRMWGGKIEKVKQGKFAGGRPPYGYNLIGGKLVPNAAEAAVVRQVFQLKALGYSLGKIAALLIEQNVPTRQNGKWSRKHIKTMLDRKKIYQGYYMHGEYGRGEDEFIEGEHEAILDREKIKSAS